MEKFAWASGRLPLWLSQVQLSQAFGSFSVARVALWLFSFAQILFCNFSWIIIPVLPFFLSEEEKFISTRKPKSLWKKAWLSQGGILMHFDLQSRVWLGGHCGRKQQDYQRGARLKPHWTWAVYESLSTHWSFLVVPLLKMDNLYK